MDIFDIMNKNLSEVVVSVFFTKASNLVLPEDFDIDVEYNELKKMEYQDKKQVEVMRHDDKVIESRKINLKEILLKRKARI